MVTMPPEVVRMRASSTVFVKASSLVKRDLADILAVSCDTNQIGRVWWQLGDRSGTRRVVQREDGTGGNATGPIHD